MRTARLVGLSPDGMSLIVTTDGGDELAIATDDRLRAAVRGDLPRLGQLENEMETTLSPRDIQARIRGGASLAQVAEVAGLPMDRVERFAAPVLAERDHVAITAMSGSVRRRGETSGHRNLRITVTERLVGRGVDIDAIAWDSYRLDDGRWTVTADYTVADGPRHAEFVYDSRARFSVAGNENARWLLGEQPPTGPGAGSGDTEPTVDLSDELALVRATQEAPAADPPEVDEGTEPTIAVVRTLQAVPRPPEPVDDEPVDDEPVDDEPVDDEPVDDEPVDDEPEPEGEPEPVDSTAGQEQPAGSSSTLDEMLSAEDEEQLYAGLSDDDAPAQVTVTKVTVTDIHVESVVVRAVDLEELEPTAADLEEADWADEADGADGADDPAVASATSRPTDASAVPATAEGGGWEPGIVVDVPVEPSNLEDPGTDEPAPPDPIVDGAGRADEVREFELESELDAPPVRKPTKKKRASVPSWDEIMFGGPRPPTT